jgi:L-aminopeptidase/D-esterase-like protein
MKGLTDIPGILVGHASDFDALTGCTVILTEQGAVAGVDVRGSASGTEELNLLDPMHITERIHAVVFSGGSAFGLETASGVRRWLEHKGVGFQTPYARVPLVFGAILYDLGLGKSTVRPTREMGETAAGAATANAVAEGAVGAGTGASVGKALGMQNATKSGLGSATVALEGRYTGVLVSALAVVNAVGDVRDPSTGKIVAGTRLNSESMQFADTSLLVRGGAPAGFRGGNTTLVALATNAALDKVEARKLAQLGSLGMARTITPVNLMSDGDLVVALSIGAAKASVDALGVAAAEAVSQAIVRAVTKAEALGGLPSATRIAAASTK